MAQTNYTPIQLYSSSTASNVPLAANLAAGELAINTNDGILFYKDSGGTVQKIGYKLRPTNAGGTGLTSFTANGVLYASNSSTLATNSALTFDGTNFTAPRTQITTAGSPPASGAGLEILGGTSPLLFAYNRGTSAYLPLNATASAFGWAISGSDAMILTSTSLYTASGINVGIGTSSPAQTLHVKTSTSATPITLGVLSNATGLPALSFNGAYASSTMAGIYGNGATASNLYYTVPANQNHYFAIADSAKMTLDSSGNLGIAQTDPTNNGVSGYTNLVIGNSTSTTAGITIRTTNTGTPAPGIVFARGTGGTNGKVYYDQNTDRLYCQAGGSGGVYLASGGTSWTSASDERVKDIIEPIENATQKLANWRTVIGKYKSDADGVRRSFLIAQDVLTTFPEAVNTDKTDEYGLNYQDLIPVLVKSIQELTARITALEGA